MTVLPGKFVLLAIWMIDNQAGRVLGLTALQKLPSLYKKYENYFDIGAAVNARTVETQKDLLIKHVNSLTAENEMKPENLQPKEGTFTFEVADKIVRFAKENNMKMRGHTLVWHNQMPEWFFTTKSGGTVSKEQLLERMKTHIQTVVTHYKDDVYCWDVVNEAIEDKENYLLRKSKWLDIIGEEFIEKAFEFAHEADPDASLFYNDYNESHPEKREKIYTLVKTLLDKGVPIHGIGLQGHWNLEDPHLDDIRRAIEKYASLGLQLQLTELDISMFRFEDHRTDIKEPKKEMLEKQADRYEKIFTLLREYKDVITCVTFWGIADDYTWLDNFPVVGRKNWPFLFDENHEPKEAFWKVIDF